MHTRAAETVRALTGGIEDAGRGGGEALGQERVVRGCAGARLQHRVRQEVVAHSSCGEKKKP